MKKPGWSFVAAVFFSGLFLGALMLLSSLVGSLFGHLPTLRLLSTAANDAGNLAALALIVTAVVVAVRAALQPGVWWRKALGVLPVFCLGLLLFGIAFEVVGIGVNGPFAMDWLMVSEVLALASVTLAAAWVALDRLGLRLATIALGISGGLGLLAWLGLIVAVGSFLLNPGAGPGGGGPPGGGLPPGAVSLGGPGFMGPLLVTVALMTIFGVVAWVTIVRALRSSRQPAASGAATVATPRAPSNTRGEAWRAFLSLVGVTLVVFAVAQLVPVDKTNAPVITPVTWDTPQDAALFAGACADCHSNETVRPWYDYIAPSSWLLASHINTAHMWWNISERNKLSPDQKQNLPQMIADALHFNIMPPHDYQFMHPSARLTPAQKDQLIAALKDVLSR
jgi:hypothetical protein